MSTKQKRYHFNVLFSVILTLLSLAALETGAAPVQTKPNYVIILADDLGYNGISCYGSEFPTPNLDQMTREGVKFTDFHSNGPLCSPTRCALLTGRYQHRAGLPALAGEEHGLDQKELTIAEVLKSAGYATAIYGKWHLGGATRFNPVHQGFDEFRGFVGGRINYYTHNAAGAPHNADWWNGDKLQAEEGYSTTLITDHSIDFIQRNKSNPFFLYVSYNAVHTPIHDPDTKQTSKSPIAYAKVIQWMDKDVGRIIAVLRDLKLEKNTLVFFCSDNGAQEVPGASNKPLRDFKGTLWEGGHRVPAIAWWPGQIPEGIVIHQPVMTMDIMPTLMELAGAEAPPEHKLDGVSLASLLQANQPLPARKLFWGKGGMLAMRDGKWKLVIDGKKISLFDVESDISEEKDLAAQQPERVKTMQMLVERWQQEVSVEKNSDVKVKKKRKSGKTMKDDA